jgi:hypothetical protein
MASPANSPAIKRLVRALQTPLTPQQLRGAWFDSGVERAFLSPGLEAGARLRALAELRAIAAYAPQPQPVIHDFMAELDRMALRILSAEGLLQDPPEPCLPPLDQAERLLQLAGDGCLPRGPIGLMAAARSQKLILSNKGRDAMINDPERSARILDSLNAALAAAQRWEVT